MNSEEELVFAKGVAKAVGVLSTAIIVGPVSMRKFIELCGLSTDEWYADMYDAGAMVVTNFIHDNFQRAANQAEETK